MLRSIPQRIDPEMADEQCDKTDPRLFLIAYSEEQARLMREFWGTSVRIILAGPISKKLASGE